MTALETLTSLGFTAIEIPLTKGKWTIVDLEDAPQLLEHRWLAIKPKHIFYAARAKADPRNGKKQTRRLFYMHRIITKADPEQQVDHHDGNGLNNRRKNLRHCNYSQNQQNVRHTRKRGFKGVSFDKTNRRWMAKIKLAGKTINLGRFETAREAAAAYDKAAQEIFREFAAPNHLVTHLK